MVTDAVDQPSLNGVGGWLIWPIANFALVISGCLFILTRRSNWIEILVIVAVLAYCSITLILTMKHAKTARYMFMAFYILAFAVTNLELLTLPKPGHNLDFQLITIAFRSAIEMSTFLYFVFSKRVRQTFVN